MINPKTNKAMNDFEVMSEMSKEDNYDISLFPDVVSIQKVKNGYHVTFGVPDAVGQQMATEFAIGEFTHYPLFYRINKKKFDEIKGLPRKS